MLSASRVHKACGGNSAVALRFANPDASSDTQSGLCPPVSPRAPPSASLDLSFPLRGGTCHPWHGCPTPLPGSQGCNLQPLCDQMFYRVPHHAAKPC